MARGRGKRVSTPAKERFYTPSSFTTRSQRKLLFEDMETNPNARTIQSTSANNTEYNVSTHNSFQSLSENDNNSHISEEDDDDSGVTKIQHATLLPKKDKTVPIFIKNYGEDFTTMSKRIKAVCKKNFTLKYLKDGVSVRTQSVEDHENLLSFIKQSHLQTHTYTLPQNKNKMAVLKGMPPDFREEEILEEIRTRIDREQVVSCTLMKTGNSAVFPMYLIKFKGDISFKQVQQLGAINHIRVYWEKYIPRNKATQCYNCQTYGHGASNCTYKPKCLKCGQEHETRACKKPKEDPPTCANCGEAHLSNSRECKAYVDYTRKIQKPKHAKTEKHGTAPRPAPLNDPEHYPSLNRWGDRANQTNSNPERLSINTESRTSANEDMTDLMELLELIKELNKICNIKEMITTIKTIMPKLKNAKNPLEQLQIYAAYLNPKNKFLFPEFDEILNTNKPTIIGGDLNSKHETWKCSARNQNGNKLLRYLSNRNCMLHAPEGVTHIPNNKKNRPSIIDLYITQNVQNFSNPVTHNELSSDHNPVTLKIYETNFEKEERLYRNYKKANWTKFKTNLEPYQLRHKEIPLTISQIEYEAEALTNKIKEQIEECIPKSKITVNSYEIDRRTKNLIKERNIARKKWQSTRHPVYRTTKNKLTRKIQYAIKKAKQEHTEREIKKLNPRDNTLWQNLKRLKRKTTKIDYLNEDNKNITEDKQIADALANNYHSIHKMNGHMSDNQTEDIVAKTIAELDSCNVETAEECEELFTNEREVLTLIKKLNNKKAPGEDGIQGIALKQVPLNIITCLVDIYNSCLSHNHFPTIWKNALVIPIHKPKKDPHKSSSFRPISLLPLLSKILEKILLTRIQESDMKLSQPEQFGFKKGHSTCHQLLRVANYISCNMARKQPTTMVLLDVEKAFDTVWHEGLVYKLVAANSNRGIRDPIAENPNTKEVNEGRKNVKLIKIIKSYLEDRTSQVAYKNKKSFKYHVAAGVPQGSLLGPVLFGAFLQDLPTTQGVHMALYADDTAIYIGGKNAKQYIRFGRTLQTHLDKLAAYYKTWKIKINVDKTEGITFTNLHKTKTSNNQNIRFEGKPLNWKSEVKYLGCVLDTRMTWKKHVEYAASKATKGLGPLYHLINQNSKLATKHKTLLYKTIIQPVLNYACPVWRSAADYNHHRLQRIQNKYLRIIHQKPYLYSTTKQNHAKSNIKPIIDTQNNLTKRFIEKAMESEHEIIKGLANITPYNTGGQNQRRLNIMIGDETYYQELQERLLNKR
ncbi:hypothetical protein WDU94_003663 [Cyamophila willieti]